MLNKPTYYLAITKDEQAFFDLVCDAIVSMSDYRRVKTCTCSEIGAPCHRSLANDIYTICLVWWVSGNGLHCFWTKVLKNGDNTGNSTSVNTLFKESTSYTKIAKDVLDTITRMFGVGLMDLE